VNAGVVRLKPRSAFVVAGTRRPYSKGLRQQRVDEATGKIVDNDCGYEISKGSCVEIEPEEEREKPTGPTERHRSHGRSAAKSRG
jgi:hypothetical protein